MPSVSPAQGRWWRAGARPPPCSPLPTAAGHTHGRPATRVASGGSSSSSGSGGGGDAGGAPPASSGAALSATGKPLAPWSLTFDLRERETLWTEENQARLVRIVAGYQLDLDVEEVEARLQELGALLPGLAARCAYVKPSTLAALLAGSPGALVPRLVTLRALLPGADIGAAAAAEPELLLLRDLAEVQADVARLPRLLGERANIDALVTAQPRFLDAELVDEVLGELRRLMPAADPVATLLGDPSWLLRVERGRKRLGDDPDT